MLSRLRLPALALTLVAMLACNQRGPSGSGAGGTGTSGSGSGSAGTSGTGTTGTSPPAAAPADTAAAISAALQAATPPDTARADGTLQLVGIDVLTAPKLFQERAAGAGPKPMEPLVAAARAAVHAVDGATAGALGDTVVAWIAVRPGKKLKVWVATPGRTDTDAARAEAARRTALAAAPEVTGPVAFAVIFDRSGKRPALGGTIPIPPELERVRDAAGGEPTPEDLIERAWQP